MAERSVADSATYHFIGIGGIGMSALAYILAGQGYRVSGSDLSDNSCTQRLAQMGVRCCQGHAADNIQGQPQVVRSTAIKPNNPELAAAIDRQLPIRHRSDILAQLINERPSIGVAGTHGKTTTSSLIACMMLKAGLDPTAAIGGEVEFLGGNARIGRGDYFVAEADESDGSLVKLKPTIGVITNIELDHTDRFQTLDEVVEVFQQFANGSQVTIASLDCPTVATSIPVDVGYSLEDHPDAVYWARDIEAVNGGTVASVWERGELLGTLRLQLLGHHNVSNALAAIAVGRQLGLEFDVIAEALADCEGARRRFELKGAVNTVQFVDDYAHHPTEIEATLRAASTQQQRIVAVFQPHRYSRVASLFDEFAHSFAHAATVIVVPIYAAGEQPLPGCETKSAQTLATAIEAARPSQTDTANGQSVYYEPDLANLSHRLVPLLQTNDLVVFLGAGNLNRSIPDIMSAYRQQTEHSEAKIP